MIRRAGGADTASPRGALSSPDRVLLADVLDGAANLRLGPDGVPENPLVVVDLDGADWSSAGGIVRALSGRHPVLVGHASNVLPPEAVPVLEALSVTIAPGGPGRTWCDGDLPSIVANSAVSPRAAFTLDSVLRVTPQLGAEDGLVVESLAYSMLLAGPEFAAWRAATPRRSAPDPIDPVVVDRKDDVLHVHLNRPERRNAFGMAVRDGLLSALAVAELDPSVRVVTLDGAGPSFCSGGDLDEFGLATDPVTAHVVRLALSAGGAVHRFRDRVKPTLHGACIGAGIEVPSFASCVVAHDDAWFQLPELAMGLVPGAGGTVSIARRIGRWRTAYLALSGQPIDRETALIWGLVDGRA